MQTLYYRISAVIFVLLLNLPCALAQMAPPSDLDACVARAMKTFEVPGIALAIVKDGKLVIARGYGVRKLGDPAPVDAETLFGIASNSKAFTAAALAMLVDEHTPTMVADLQHWQFDTFKALFCDKTVPDAFVTFAINSNGKVDGAKMAAVSDLADFSFDYHDLHLKPIPPEKDVNPAGSK